MFTSQTIPFSDFLQLHQKTIHHSKIFAKSSSSISSMAPEFPHGACFTAETWHLHASKSGNVATGSSWDSGIMVLAPEAKTCNQGWIWLKCCLRWFNPNLPTIVKHVFFKQSSNILFKMVQDCWSDCWKMVQDVSRGFETVLDGLGWFKAISMYLRNQQLWYVLYRG